MEANLQSPLGIFTFLLLLLTLVLLILCVLNACFFKDLSLLKWVLLFFSHFAAVLLEIRNFAFLNPLQRQSSMVVGMDWFYFLLGAFLVLGINCFFWSSGRDDLTSPFNLLLVLICLFGLAICCLKHGSCSETQSKKNSIESSCKFPPEQKYPHALIFVSRVYPAGNQFQTANRENEL